MNKAILLAPGLFLAASAFGGYTNYDLSAYTTDDVRTWARGDLFPTAGTSLTIAGVPFTVSSLGGDSDTTGIVTSPVIRGWWDPFTTDIPVNQYGVNTLYMLVNCACGIEDFVIGSITVHSLSGEDYGYELQVGRNVRDHFNGGWVNTLSDDSIRSILFTDPVTGEFNRFDMQSIALPSWFQTDTLTSVTLEGYGLGRNGCPIMAGLTTDAVPEPTTGLALLTLLVLAKRRRCRS